MSDVNVSVAEVQENPGWVKFVSVMIIIYGVFCCLTIVGIAIAIPMFYIAKHLRKAASDAQSFKDTHLNELAAGSMVGFLKAFKIYGILMIIGLGFMVIYLFSLPALIAAMGGFEALF